MYIEQNIRSLWHKCDASRGSEYSGDRPASAGPSVGGMRSQGWWAVPALAGWGISTQSELMLSSWKIGDTKGPCRY